MQRRRELMMQTHKPDTTLKIAQENAYWRLGEITPQSNSVASILYSYPASTEGRKLVYSGLVYALNVFQDGVYKDYWSCRSDDQRNVLNANTNQIAVSAPTRDIDDAYAYLPDTGQILFAGKNTPYYGYTNINDMPSA